MQPSDLWTMMQLMTRSMRPRSTVASVGLVVGGVGGRGSDQPWASPSPVFPPNQRFSFPRPIAKPPVMPVLDYAKTPIASHFASANVTPSARPSQCPRPQIFKQTPHGPDITSFKTDSVSSSQPSLSKAPASCGDTRIPNAPPAAVSKSAVNTSSSLKQREQDQAWIDDFLRDRGHCEAGRAERKSGSEMTPLDRERRKRKKKEWRRRRRLSPGEFGKRNSESGATAECAMNDSLDPSETIVDPLDLKGGAASQLVTDTEVSTLTAEVNTTLPLSGLSHRDSEDSFKIEKREKRREMADLDKLEAKINALEKLRNLRRNAAEKGQSGRDGNTDKKLLDELVADSVFDSRLEKLGGWIEKRREMIEEAKS